MTEVTPGTTVVEPVAPVVPNPAPETPVTPPEPKADEPKFTQAQLEAIVKERLDRERKASDEKRRKELEDAEAKKLAEQGEFKTIAEREKARADELEARLKQRDFDALRAKVAADNKLPAEWASRLLGGDEAALDADAKALAKTLIPSTPVPGASPSPRPAGLAGGPNDEAAQSAQRRSILSSW